jgi:hypothetical protein
MKTFGVIQSYQFHNHKFYIPVEYKDGKWEPIGDPCNDASEAWSIVEEKEGA